MVGGKPARCPLRIDNNVLGGSGILERWLKGIMGGTEGWEGGKG